MNNKIQGFGKLILNYGEFYEGEFIEEKKEWYGKYYYSDGKYYDGQ